MSRSHGQDCCCLPTGPCGFLRSEVVVAFSGIVTCPRATGSAFNGAYLLKQVSDNTWSTVVTGGMVIDGTPIDMTVQFACGVDGPGTGNIIISMGYGPILAFNYIGIVADLPTVNNQITSCGITGHSGMATLG